jgi:sulfur carrier protein ThiS adenylyltransferase
MNLTRQEDIISTDSLGKKEITLIGAGGIGSPTALTLAKMGVKKIEMFDEDGVSELNLSSQVFKKSDVKQFKVFALKNILKEFSDTVVLAKNKFYKSQKLRETVIVATDSMDSRRLVWAQFLKQDQCKYYVEARMGAQLGIIYVIKKVKTKGSKKYKVRPEDIKFYEDVLHPNEKIKPLPCTAKAIIYNVFMISSLICRAFKGIVEEEDFPREVIFNMTNINEQSYMFRQ